MKILFYLQFFNIFLVKMFHFFMKFKSLLSNKKIKCFFVLSLLCTIFAEIFQTIMDNNDGQSDS